jgi:hypothetical protein
MSNTTLSVLVRWQSGGKIRRAILPVPARGQHTGLNFAALARCGRSRMLEGGKPHARQRQWKRRAEIARESRPPPGDTAEFRGLGRDARSRFLDSRVCDEAPVPLGGLTPASLHY